VTRQGFERDKITMLREEQALGSRKRLRVDRAPSSIVLSQLVPTFHGLDIRV
jgi:hypothetical protein